jgi:peptidoglycan/LPS O-acetylase OafA/YrhL
MNRAPIDRKRLGQYIFGLAWATFAVGSSILLVGKDTTGRVEVVAFYAGVGGMLLMFFRWQKKQDRLAQILVLAAFAVWVVAIPVGSASWKSGTWIAGGALLIGFLGAVVVLIRAYLSSP